MKKFFWIVSLTLAAVIALRLKYYAADTTDEEIMITKNGRPAAVLVSPEEFENLKETVAVRSDSALMKEIKKGLRALKMKRAKLYTLDELFR